MPAYKLCLIVRATSKAVSSCIKRAALSIMERQGILSEIEHLGEKQLPYRMRAHQEHFTMGRYVFLHFHGAPTLLGEIKDEIKMDEDIIRFSVLKLAPLYRIGHTLSSVTVNSTK